MLQFQLLYLVKYILLLLFVFNVCSVTHLCAQNEHWDTYMVKMGSAPASVLVDMGFIETAPDRRFPFLVITGPKTKNCTTMGLIDKEEIGVLEDMLTATGNFLTGVTPKILVGTVTRNCERVNYYYVKDTAGVRTALNRLYTHSFKDNAYVLGIRSDPEWDTYRKFLYPDEGTRNWMDNDKIITKMMQQGDSLKTARAVSFNLCFRSDTDRAGFSDYAKSKGYTVSVQNGNTGIPDMPYGISVSAVTRINLEIINPKSSELKVAARNYHGFYNGWEAK